jgi:NADH:ubiquinone oxidoreductase subunit H
MPTQSFGLRGSLSHLSRYYLLFLWSVITATMFLGAWKIPEVLSSALSESSNQTWIKFFELLTLLVKVYLIMFVITWMNKSNPQGRVDQLTRFAWNILSPLALLALAGSSVWAGVKALL